MNKNLINRKTNISMRLVNKNTNFSWTNVISTNKTRYFEELIYTNN